MGQTGSGKQLLSTASGGKWKRIGTHKRAGLLAPLFSFYSQKSTGIGDLYDLKLLIDWASKTGNSIIQLLPMNEVGITFCPYDSISSFALEPMYISIEMLSGAKDRSIKVRLGGLRKKFPVGYANVDYRVKQEKMGLLWDMYLKDEETDEEKFHTFIDENAYWLNDFAVFKVLKDYHKGRSWVEWEEGYKKQDAPLLKIFARKHEKEIVFQMWIQWLLFTQFKKVKQYASSKKVLIKGDLPILVSMDSADVWTHPDFFKMEFAAGAPPDMYCEKGQRWGTPTYNWERIAEDGYAYLKEKLKFAENFYDILRIDHVVGLFRIWSISCQEPMENKGLHGFFDPKEENKWGEQGRKILSVMLENSNMLLCAEDLGIIPKVCTQTLKEFGIPGNDVQRWVKDWQISHDFLPPDEYRAISVAMLSTHDTTNWAAWWENEAGTVDEALFVRKCKERGIDYSFVKSKLFDMSRSNHGRLRWLESIISSAILVSILGKRREEVLDFIDMYENSYLEKEKLWKKMNLSGPMREKADREIIASALKITLHSSAVFCVQLIIDWLGLTDILKGDPYRYRINKPGTIAQHNWSLTIPLSLEGLLKHPVCNDIKKMVDKSARIVEE